MMRSVRCTHLGEIRDVEPRTPAGCEECLATGDVSGSIMTSRGHRQLAIVAEQAAEAGPPLDLTTDHLHTSAAGGGRP